MFASLYESFTEIRPGKPKWTGDDIPDLSGKVMIVTGANTGIGKETAKQLARHNAKVYVAARNEEKARAAMADIKQSTGKDTHFLQLDLGDIVATKKAAAEFKSKEKELHVLFNNAGIMMPPPGQKTTQGYEIQFGTNVLGHYVFTTELLDVLEATAKNGDVRVINTSSSGHQLAPWGGINFDNLKEGKGNKMVLYGQSKLGNVLFTNELAKKYTDKGIISISLNPGNITTDLQRHIGLFERTFASYVLTLAPAEYGALTQLWAGTSPEITRKDSGAYMIPWARRGHLKHSKAKDEALADKLWEWCSQQAKL